MKKVLFIGDPHLDINRFHLAKQFISWLNSTIKDIRPDLVVNLGDTFDTHSVIRSEIMTEFIDHVDLVRSLNIPYIYLVGNHDMYKPKDSKYHALRHLVGKLNNFYIIDSITDLFGMTFVPYQANPLNFPKKSLPICVAHQTFIGADYGAFATKDGVDAATLKGCEVVISGHIHMRHKIPARDGRGVEVTYPGSPFSQSAEDIDQVKGLTLFDLETWREEFIESPLPSWRSIKYNLDEDDTIETMCENLVETLTTKDHWRVQITGKKAEILNYLNSEQHKKIIKDIDITIDPTFTDKKKQTVKIEARSMSQIISDYVTKVYNGTLDKQLLRDRALELIKQSNLEQ